MSAAPQIRTALLENLKELLSFIKTSYITNIK